MSRKQQKSFNIGVDSDHTLIQELLTEFNHSEVGPVLTNL